MRNKNFYFELPSLSPGRTDYTHKYIVTVLVGAGEIIKVYEESWENSGYIFLAPKQSDIFEVLNSNVKYVKILKEKGFDTSKLVAALSER